MNQRSGNEDPDQTAQLRMMIWLVAYNICIMFFPEGTFCIYNMKDF